MASPSTAAKAPVDAEALVQWTMGTSKCQEKPTAEAETSEVDRGTRAHPIH